MGRDLKKHSPTHTHPDHQTSFINFSIYYDPQHTPCSIYVLGSPFPQPLSGPSLVYLLVWNPLLHTPYISSPNYYLPFATHAHIITNYFSELPKLCNLFLISLSSHHLEIYPPDHSHLCSLKCHPIFFPYRPGLTSMQHAASHTTAVQLPP